MPSAELISGLERCPRIPYWGRNWKLRKLKPVEMIEAGVRAGIMEPVRSDYGQVAGEEVYSLGSDPGIDSKRYNQHSEVVHLAALADVVVTAVRRQGSDPWKPAPSLPDWDSACYLSPDGTRLRRIVLVTSWSDDRHYSLCRQWETMGEVCMHGLPMQLAVVILGQHREGKYHSFWTHGLRHPSNKKLRFRKKQKLEEPFKGSWITVWREDYDEISTHDWLEAMLQDEVLQDVCFTLNIEAPAPKLRQRMIDLARRKLEIVRSTKELPLQNLSTCDWPAPCVHRAHCHVQDEPSPAYGFVAIDRVRGVEP